jgi:hypothetical protein
MAERPGSRASLSTTALGLKHSFAFTRARSTEKAALLALKPKPEIEERTLGDLLALLRCGFAGDLVA